jgi:hypothetical protein
VRSVHAGICRLKGTSATVIAPAVTAELRAMVESHARRPKENPGPGHAPPRRRGRPPPLRTRRPAPPTPPRPPSSHCDDPKPTPKAANAISASPPAPTPPPARPRPAGLDRHRWHRRPPPILTIDRGGRLGDTRASDRAVAEAVQRAARAAGFDPARYAGHSLRALPGHRRRGRRTLHHEPDRPQIPSDGPPLHRRRDPSSRTTQPPPSGCRPNRDVHVSRVWWLVKTRA